MMSKLRMAQALCLALTLTFVPAILCVVTVISSYELYLEYKDWQWRRSEAAGSSTYETLVVDSEGRAAVAVRDSRGQPQRFLDERRLAIDIGKNVRWLVGSWLLRAPQKALPLRAIRDFPVESLAGARQEENWFFVCDRETGRAIFEGYDVVTHRRIGFIDRNGFDAGPRDKSKGFPVSGPLAWGPNQELLTRADFEYRYHEYELAQVRFDHHDPVRPGQWVLQSGQQLFLVDSIARAVTELLPGTPVRSIVPASRVLPAAPDPEFPVADASKRQFEYQKWLAARTTDRVILVNPDAGRREDYVLPPDWNDRDFELYLPSDGTAVLTSQAAAGHWRDIRPGIREYDVDVASISRAGEILRQARVPLQVSYRSTPPSERAQHWLPALAVPGPLPSAVLAGVVIPWFDSRIHQTRFAGRVVVSLGETWPVLAFVTLLAIGLAWLSDRHLRAFREPRSYVWLAFVFLLGLPGYVAWYCHRRWPVRHPAPPPVRTGTEIFA
jgi:hypothetical protein